MAEVDQVAVVAVQAAVLDVLAAVVDAEDVLGVAKHALENVEVDALEDVEAVVGVQDVEAHVQAHARQVEKARLVLHAIAAPDALVRVLRVLRVADVVDVAAVHTVVTAVQENAVVDVLAAVVDVLAAVVDAKDAVLDAMAHVLAHATGVVMDVLDNVKTHVLLTAQQHVQVPAKLKHLVP